MNYYTEIDREEDMEPRVIRVELPENDESAGAWPTEIQIAAANTAFQARRVEQEREWFRRALRDARWQFINRLEAI